MKRHEEQKRNFEITKARLESMKPNPSISIDELISKLLVSSNKVENSANLPNSTKANSKANSLYSAPNFENQNDSDNAWVNSQSQSFINGLNEVKCPKIKDSAAIVDEFDEFSSFSSSFRLTNFNPPSKNDPIISQSSISTKLVIEPTSQIQEQTATNTELITDEDGFKDFQGCTCESASPLTISDPQPPKELQTDGWLKCLAECRSMLSESASALSPLASDSDTNAFLSTPRGSDFIYELVEIYGICQRIRLAASLGNMSDPHLQEVFNQIDQTWSDLAKFVNNQEHKEALKSRLSESIKATSPVVDALSVEPNCGVCVTPVSPSNGPGAGSAVISLAGRVYHASCANLWVNRVEFSLPSLRAP